MERKKRLISCALLILGIVAMIPHTTKGYEEEQENYFETQSGIPDAVSGTTSNTTHHLTVVANSDRIEDKEEFARTVIHMCIDNSFHSVRFSTDIRGYPTGLDISVYLNRKDIEEKKEPVYRIKFETNDFSKGYNIKDNTDEFHLLIDGVETKFY